MTYSSILCFNVGKALRKNLKKVHGEVAKAVAAVIGARLFLFARVT